MGPPVAHRPEGIGVAPQELGAHGQQRAALPVGGRGTAPPHQPAHRRLHPIPRPPGWPATAPYSGYPSCRADHAAMAVACGRWRRRPGRGRGGGHGEGAHGGGVAPSGRRLRPAAAPGGPPCGPRGAGRRESITRRFSAKVLAAQPS
ncbi:hypothetical protein GZL_04911 [Streptomyces sp. 769]|nr:hypothetical protein GZL_04911 [Streptomyces sp. 769]